MELLVVSFLAGVLTVAAPCILPLLPVIIGGSIVRGEEGGDQSNYTRPLIIALSLGVSVLIFTLLLKASTQLIGVPQEAWQYISGGIILFLGISFLLPDFWEKIIQKTGVNESTNKLAGKSLQSKNKLSDITLGAALGPVFSSCSPTYLLIVATVFPASFTEGFIYLLAYSVGLAATLLVVSIGGQKVVRKLGWLSDPNGWFKRTVGLLFIIVAIAIIFGLDKDLQAFILERGWYDPIGNLEESLR